MTIHLPPDVEKSLMAKVHSGMFPSLDAAMTRAARLLLEQTEQAPAPKTKAVKRGKGKAEAPKKPLTRAEFDQHLLSLGLLSQLPDTDADFDDPDDEPVPIKGEPLSETVIRERR